MVRMLGSLLFVVALPVLAESSYRIEPATVALGEPVTVTITSKPGMLEKVDLAPLAENFEIHGRNQGGDGKEESLVLTLYPLRTGRHILPNLGLRLRPPTLTVHEQSETVPKVRFGFETTPVQYHMRQFVRLTIEACDDGSLMWQRPQLPTREGLFLRPLNEEQIDVERNGERCTAHRWHWSVMPAVAGENKLNVPMMEANKFGQRLRFPPPEVMLEALPVPAWLPADTAIGKPEILVSPVPEEWPVNRPLAWSMEIVGSYSAEALKNLLRLQLSNLPQFGRYEPVIEEIGNDNGVPRYSVVLYSVFAKPAKGQLPDLIFPWYDNGTGKLQQVKVSAAHLQIFNPAMQRLLTWLVWLGAVLFAVSAAYLAWRHLGWRLRRWRALADLKRIAGVDGLSSHLCAFSLRADTKPSATLGDWQKRMHQEARMQGLEKLVHAVEAARFGESQFELVGLIEQARRCLATAAPKP